MAPKIPLEVSFGSSWKDVRVVFIPKMAKQEEQSPKYFLSISLSFFFLATMEKIVDNCIRITYLIHDSPHANQLSYQHGKSTETGIHSLILQVNEALAAKETVLFAFIDIQGAVDNNSYKAIEGAMIRKYIVSLAINWTATMLQSGENQNGGSLKTILSTRRCPQVRVLFLSSELSEVDELLEPLTRSG